MKTYTVHEPPGAPADRMDRAELLRFIKDGFDWNVFLFGPLALLWRGLPLAALAYVVAAVTMTFALAAAGADSGWISMVLLALNAIAAYEVGEVQRRALERKGWSVVGSVVGNGQDECERRFLEAWLPREPMIRARGGAHTELASHSDDERPGGSSGPDTSRTGLGARLAGLRQRLSGSGPTGAPNA